jgi:phosphatidylserine decarboxylase
MRFDSAGYPFIVGALAAAGLAGVALGWPFTVPFVVLAGFFLFYFRDPERQVAAADDAFVSPADGRVLVA